MKKILIFKYFILLTLLVLSGCKKDDFTGESTLDPTETSLTVSNVPEVINFVEKDSVFTFTLTLSQPQVVDTRFYISQVSGDASLDSDFKIMNDGGFVTIPAGATTGQVSIKILADDIKENSETFVLKIGDNRSGNVSVNPVEVTFTIGNALSDALSIEMSWETNVADVVGLDLDPDEVVDMRLLIIDSDDAIAGEEDGATFETYSDFSSLPDGTYRIATDVYSTIDAGDFDAPISLSIALKFNQSGAINDAILEFPNVMENTKYDCDIYRTYLATVVKSGSSYTLAKSVKHTPEVTTWNSEDAGYDSEVTTSLDCNGPIINNLNTGWMEDFWGEVIVERGAVNYEISGNTITIPLQKYLTTTYKGALQKPYYIEGTGTIDNSGNYPVWTIKYDLIQDGGSIIQWCFDNGYWDTNYLEAVITTEPASVNLKAKTQQKVRIKPKR